MFAGLIPGFRGLLAKHECEVTRSELQSEAVSAKRLAGLPSETTCQGSNR
jgi:hypothetical protein